MAISPVRIVWRAFNFLSTISQKLRIDGRQTKVERSNPAVKLVDKSSGKFGELNVS